MAMDVGTGTTITFATSAFTAQVMSLSASDITREDIDVTHMGSTVYKEFQPSDLVDGGSIEMEIGFDPDAIPPISGASETITIAFPLPSGQITPADLAFSGYVSSWTWTAPMEEVMTATITIKVDGKTDPVWTASA